MVEPGIEVATTEHPTQAHPALVSRQPEPLMVTPQSEFRAREVLYNLKLTAIKTLRKGG